MRHLYGFMFLIGIHIVTTEATHATLIERTVVIDLEADGGISQFDRQAWKGIVEVEKFYLQAGDQLKLMIRFANNQHLELTDHGSGIQGGLEPTKLTLLFEDQALTFVGKPQEPTLIKAWWENFLQIRYRSELVGPGRHIKGRLKTIISRTAISYITA